MTLIVAADGLSITGRKVFYDFAFMTRQKEQRKKGQKKKLSKIFVVINPLGLDLLKVWASKSLQICQIVTKLSINL